MFGLFKLFLFISVFINSPALKAKSFAGFVAVDKNSDTAAKEIEFNNDLQVIDFLKKANVLEEQKTAGLVFSKPGFYSTEKNQFVISTDLQLNIIKKSNGHLIWANLKSNPQFFLSSLKIELYSCAFKKIKDFFLDERGLAIIESKYLNSSCANGKQVAYLFSNYENNYSFLPIDVRFNFEVWKNYLPQKSTENRLFKILYLPSVLYPGAPLSFNLLDMIGSVKTVWIKNNVRQLSYKINKIKNPRSLFFKFLLPEKIPEGEYSVVIETTSGQFFNSDEKFLILTKNSNFYSLNIDSSFPKIFSVGSFKGFSLRVNMPKGSAPKEALILKTTFSLKDSSDYLASKVLGFDFQTPKNNSDGIKINDICAARVGNLALFKTEAEVHPEISHLVEIPEIQLCKSLQNFNITFELFSNGELVYKEQKSALVSEKNFIPFIKIEKKDSLLEANYFEYDLLTKKVSPKQRDLYLRGLTSNASLDQSFEHSIVPRFSPRLESPDHLCEKNEFGLSCKIDSHFEKYYFFTDRLVDNFYSNYAEASVNVSSQAFPTNVNLTGNLDFRLSKSIYGKNETLKLSFPTALRNSRVIVFASQKKLTLYVNSKNLSPDNNFIEVPLKNFKSGAVSVSAVMHSSVSTNAKLFKSFTQYGEKSFTISDLQPSNLLVLNKSDIDSAKFTFQTGVEFGEKIETLSLLNEDVARSINSAKIWPYDDLFLNDPESVFFTTANFFLHDRMKFSRPPQQLYEPIYNIAQQKNAEALLDVKNLSFSSTGDSFISISKKDFCGFRSDLSKSALVMTTQKNRESRRYFLSLSAMQEGTEKYISSICLNHLDLLQKSSKTVSSLEAFRSDSFKSHNADWVKYSVAQENPPNNASNYYLELRSNFKPSDLAILDKSNYLVGLFRKDYSKRQLHWVEAEELPQSLVHLLLKSEDADFYEHTGVNWKSLTASALQYLEKQESSARGGASTLSMQLVRLLSQKPRSYYRTFKGKIEQIREAKNLESRLTKNEILSVYINLASFRGELVGLRAAALFTFNKNVSDLNENESAYLVSLLPSPNAELNVISKRMCRLLERSRCDDLLELATAASKIIYSVQKVYLLLGL